ncbi:MAG: protein-L-isoaspartate(D-aspartate) O-methyltransferase [Pseudomonadota bacterium]
MASQAENEVSTERMALIRLIMTLRRQGITEPELLSAIERTPRDLFIPEAHQDEAFDDVPVVTAHGDHLAQPSILAFMLQTLEVDRGHKVLEIGTGTGFVTAIMALMARRVFSIERDHAILKAAEARFARLDRPNIVTLYADGLKGWPLQAPFDRIVVTGACLEPPAPLLDQLAPAGRLVLPLYTSAEEQHLAVVDRTPNGFEETICLPVHFNPVRTGLARNA